jgi:hypothetical protein
VKRSGGELIIAACRRAAVCRRKVDVIGNAKGGIATRRESHQCGAVVEVHAPIAAGAGGAVGLAPRPALQEEAQILGAQLGLIFGVIEPRFWLAFITLGLLTFWFGYYDLRRSK